MGRASTITTNQDPTMKEALEIVFPRTFHHLCQWYITNKMGDKIMNVYRNCSAVD